MIQLNMETALTPADEGRWVLVSDQVNSYGFQIDLEHMSLDRIRSNPVLLWNHQRSERPLGRLLDVRYEKANGVITGGLEFNPKNTQMSWVQEDIEAGYLRAGSIGFLTTKVDFDAEVPLVQESAMYEYSIVTVGADPNAVKQSLLAVKPKLMSPTEVDVDALMEEMRNGS